MSDYTYSSIFTFHLRVLIHFSTPTPQLTRPYASSISPPRCIEPHSIFLPRSATSFPSIDIVSRTQKKGKKESHKRRSKALPVSVHSLRVKRIGRVKTLRRERSRPVRSRSTNGSMPGDWWPADCQRRRTSPGDNSRSTPLPFSPRFRFSRSLLWPTRARGVKNREQRRLDGPGVVRHRRQRDESVLEWRCLCLFLLPLLLPASQPLANRSILSRHPRVSAFYRIIKQSRVIRHTRFAGF